MRRGIVRILAAVTVGSFLIAGSAFAGSMHYSGEQMGVRVKEMFNNAFSNQGQELFKDGNSFSANNQSISFLTKEDKQPNYPNDYGTPGRNAHDYNSPGNAPVPEPATMLLLGTGLVGLAGVARRKNKK